MAKRKGTTYMRVFHRVGRNEPCPCGSGKKHKKCCGDKFNEIYKEVQNGIGEN